LSDVASATWQGSSAAPVVLRSLPAEAGVLSGRIRFQLDARGGDGRGSVQWQLKGPAASLTIGNATGRPIAVAPLSWSAELTWDSSSVPDGSYTVSAVVTGTSGQQTRMSAVYRIQNAAGPIAPINLTATSQAGGVALTWQQASSASGLFYRLFRDQSVSGTPMTEISADRRSYLDAGAQPGRHLYEIVLVDSQGRSSQPVRAELMLGAAANVQAEAGPDLQVLLPTGQSLAPGGRVTDRVLLIAPAVAGLNFQISTDGNAWNVLPQSARCAEDVCSLDLRTEGLAAGPYSVRAFTARGTSPAHSFIRAEPTRYRGPTGLTAELTGLGVQLSWQAPPSAIPASYYVARRHSGGEWELLDQVARTSFIDAGAPAGRTSDYRVSAIDLEGEVGAPCASVSVSIPAIKLAELAADVPPAAAPTRVQVHVAQGRATLNWGSVLDSDGYLIERRLESSGAFAAAGRAGGESFVDSPVLAAHEVTYRVVSLNRSVEGPASAVATTFVMPTAAPGPVVESPLATSRPEAPSALKIATEAGAIRLTWSPSAASAPSATFNVYRLDPTTGAFGLAASGLATPSFTDSALPASGRFGYVVTASSASGTESVFSEPSWATVPAAPATLGVELLAPTALDSSLIEAENLRALARVTGAVGLDQISFAIAPASGLWRELSAVPADPRRPAPDPVIGAAPAALWGTIFNTTPLAPGSYKLRVQVRDRAGHVQEQVQDLYLAGPAARGPPPFALSATTTPGGVRLEWGDTNPGGFLVQRSQFGPGGPFETVASVRAQHYDDFLAIPGQAYTYKVVGLGSSIRPSAVATATALGGQVLSPSDGPSVHLGAVTKAELSVTVAVAQRTHPLTAGLRALSGTHEIDATSFATAQQVHQLGEEAQITFVLPSGLTADESAAAAIYHWDDSANAWVKEASAADPTLSSVSATITHFSQFALALSPSPAGGGNLAQPPLPPTDSAGSQARDQSLRLPAAPPQYEVDPDGEVVSLRNAHSNVFKKPGGYYQQVISAGLVNYMDAKGSWQKIDSTLVQNVAGLSGVRNRANSFQVDLPGAMNEREISLAVGSEAIKMTLVGAGATSLLAKGNRASYAAALPGVDVTYDVIPSGLKESLVVHKRPISPAVFAFKLNTGSLILRQQPNGSVQAVDAAGRTRFTIEAPWMHDAPTHLSELGTTSNLVALTLTGGPGSYLLTYTPDAKWLNDPARLYPITIDPSLTVNWGNSSEYDTQINECLTGNNYNAQNYLPIGFTYFDAPCSKSYRSRAMVQFSGFLGDGLWPIGAGMYLYQYTNYGTGRGNCCTLFNAYAATSSWTFTGVTWSNQPAATDAYGSGQAYALTGAGWVGWDVTSLVRSWESHALANNGLVMYTPLNETGPANNNEFFYGGRAVGSCAPQPFCYPYMTVNYDTYGYQSAVSLPSYSLTGTHVVPNGGSTPVEVYLRNIGGATWGTDTQLNYRWWSGGAAVTGWQFAQYMPYNVPTATSTSVRFNLASPSLTTTGPVQLQLGLRNNAFWFGSLSWGSPSYACDQFYAYAAQSTVCSVSGATNITLADESATIAWQGSPQVLSAVAGSLLSIPLTLTNTSATSGRNYTWRAYRPADLIRVGIRDYRSTAGSVIPLANLPNLRTYLQSDVGPQGSLNLNAVIQAPGEPGDYLLRVDLVHETPTSTLWFADQGNQALEVRARILAPGDDKTTHVPVPLGDGSSLAVSTSNGFPTLSATDFNIPERGGASLHLSRTFNGVNGLLTSTGTYVTSTGLGAGWTFDFQRSVRLGSLGVNTYDPASGILVDAQGRAWTLSWNAGRGLYEDAAGNRTVTPSSATVTSTIGNLTIPTRPVDLINGAGAVVADPTAPGGNALRLEGTSGPPTALIMPAGSVPTQQNGTIEFWFKPNFDMTTDTACHVFFADAQMRFALTWNCPYDGVTQPWGWNTGNTRLLDFVTYDADASTWWHLTPTTTTTWTNASGWHHIAVTWAESGLKQVMPDSSMLYYSTSNHSQSPVGDLIFGYGGPTLNYLNGRIAQLRIDGRVVPGNGAGGELYQDAQPSATLSATPNTLYLGQFASGYVNSSATTYLLRKADQSTETYSSVGTLLNEADRFGNQIDYIWNGGSLSAIADHSIPGRSIGFTYNASSYMATDLAGRTVTYQLNGAGDLISVSRSNLVPDARTGVVTSQTATTSYSYASGHQLKQVTDPRGARTTINYDQSYRQVVMADTPTAYWRLGENSGTSANDQAGNNTGTLRGGVTVGQGGALWGDSDPAYKFDGSTGYISVTPFVGAATALTVEVWLKTTGTAGSFVNQRTAGNVGGFSLESSGNSAVLYINIGGAWYGSVGTKSINDGLWHHVVGTWDGSFIRMYIDGGLSGTPAAAAGTLNNPAGQLFQLANSATTWYYPGSLDEVAVYSAALSTLRIQAHFIAGRLGVGASTSGYAANVLYDTPAGYWRLGEGSGSRAFDLSGGANNGTYSGGVTLGQAGALGTDPGANAATFDGSTGNIAFTDNAALYGAGQIAVEAWAKATSWVAGASIVNRRTAAAGGFTLEVANTGGQIAFYVWVAGAWRSAVTQALAQGLWHHLVGTYDGTNVQIYADGQLAGSAAFTGAANNPGASSFQIGKNTTAAYYFSGSIQEPALYAYALSSTRIFAHYRAGKSALSAGSMYASAVLGDSPRGYWRLGETFGAVAGDSSPYGNSGAYGGGFTLVQPGALANDPNYSVRLDGSSGNVAVPANASLNVGATVTIEAWIDKTSATIGPIVEYGNTSSYGVHLWNYPTWDALYVNLVDTAGVGHAIQSPAGTFTTNAWYHVAAVYDGAYGTLYVNGVQVARNNLGSFVPQTTYALNIGKRPLTSGLAYFTGLIDEAAVYAGALSPARILAHYQASRLGAGAPTGWSLGTYAANVSADQPVGYWRLGEASGQAADSSGNAHPSTIANAISYSTPGAIIGDTDNSIGFNGTSSYLSIPYTASLAPASAISLEVWLKTGANPGVIAILLDSENGSFAKGAKLNFDTTGHAQFQLDPQVVITSGVLSLNAWHHVVGTYDGSNQRLYVDGALVGGPSPGTYVANDGGAITIGASTNGTSNFWNGNLDEAAIYNYALTPARILAHYNSAWDLTRRRVTNVQDARGSNVASFIFNDDLATTQVIDGRGLSAYYTFQQYGGRTLSVTDTGNNVIRYEYDGGAAYRLLATVSPTGIRQSRWINSGAPVGQQEQVLMTDTSAQPSTVKPILMAGGYPDPGSSAVTSEPWIWDSSLTVQPGIASHRSTPGVVGLHQHSVTFANGWLVPPGGRVTQWVYLESGVQLPGNLMLQFSAADSTAWAHRAFWGTFNLQPDTATSCPSYCFQGVLPTPARWVPLTVALGPTSPVADLDLAGRTMNGVGFGAVGGTGAVWWGPTILEFPAAAVSDPMRTVARSAYNATNDLLASVDANGIASIQDVDANGLTRVSSTGVEPSPGALLFSDGVSVIGTNGWTQEFTFAGTGAGVTTAPLHNGVGSINQNHNATGLQSALYKDVTGLSPGTYVRVSVWVQTSGGSIGAGGASLMVENRLAALSNIQRRTAAVQPTPGQWVQLTLPYIVDTSGQVRIHLWHENLQGTTTWADLRIDDLTPAPDVTLQHPLAAYATSFETDSSSWTLGTATAVKDSTLARTGQYSIKDTLAANNTTNLVQRAWTLPAATYRVTAWVKTILSGSNGGAGGAQLCAQTCSSTITTEGQWQQLSVSGSGTLTVQLKHANWQGDVYWDDLNVERVADANPASSGLWQGTAWTGTVTSATASWASSWSGGVGAGPSRQVTITSSSVLTDVRDTLQISALRTNATYVISVWAKSSVPNTTIDLSLRDASFNALPNFPMDSSTACTIQTTPTLCQNSVTYKGGDRALNNLVIYYGGPGSRTVTISHPLVALASQRQDFTQFGQLTRTYDIFGHQSRIDYNSQSLYPIDSAQVLGSAPPPNYRAEVMADKPIAYWRLGDSGTGTVAADSSGNNNPGTISGGVTKGIAGALPADSDTAMSFDGTSGTIAVNLPTINTAPGGQVTVELWMYAPFTEPGGSILFGFNPYNLEFGGTTFGFNTANRGDVYGVPLSALPLNIWVHVAAVFTNGNVTSNQLYFNGVQQSLSQLSGTPASYSVTAQAKISGWAAGPSNQFNGRLDEVAVYNSALTSMRVQAHYQAGVVLRQQRPNYRAEVLADAPAAYWRLDETGAGTVAADLSGNNNSGTISGGVVKGLTGALTTDTDAAMGFDGASGTVTVNLAGINTAAGAQTTVELWMYWLGSNTCCQMPFGFNNYDLELYPGGGFGFNTANGDLYGMDLSLVPQNAWVHVAAVFTNGNVTQNQLYLNGVQQTLTQRVSTPVARSVTPQANISGWPTYANARFNGRLDEVSVYYGTLSATRIQAHYQAGVASRPQPPNYRSEVLVDAPIGYWRLDELTGTVAADLSGNNNPGTISGGVMKGVAGALPGDSDTAMNFDGTSGTIAVNLLAVNTASGGQVTVEFWMYWAGGSNTATLFGFNSYNLEFGGGPFGFNTLNGDIYGVQMSAVPQNAWVHVAAVFTNGNVTQNQIYFNGVQQALSQQIGTPAISSVTPQASIAGMPTSTSYRFGGRLDEVAVYNGALSASRVQAHYQAGVAPRLQPPNYAAEVMVDAPISYWRLGEYGSGTAAADISGNNNTGTISSTGVTKYVWGALPADWDGAFSFDGGTGTIGVNVPRINTSSGGQVTVEEWVYWYGGAVGPMIFGFNSYALTTAVSGTVSAFGFTTGNGDVYGVPLSALPQNSWVHVTAVFTNGNVTQNQLYINGVQQTLSQQGTGTPVARSVTAQANISGWPTDTRFKFNGSLDEVAIYNGALNATRIQAHYQAGIAPYGQAAPGLLTSFVYNALGQLVSSTRVGSISTSITERRELDSWGRVVAQIANWIPGPAVDSKTNIRAGRTYDLNGNMTDVYSQSQVSGNWIDNRYLFDANSNQVASIMNCVTVTNPCDGASNAAQNVVTAFAFDALNKPLDTYAPLPGCTASCVPIPVCNAADCNSPVTPCPSTTCVDTRAVYDSAGRLVQQIANYNGTQDVSQANVSIQYAYDADGRVVDVFMPITNAALQTGQIDQRKAYDVLGRLISDVKAYSIPNWMTTTTQARTDYSVDAGGRVVSITGPGMGSTSQSNRIVTTADYDDLGRALSIATDPTGLNAVSRRVYDPRGALRSWTPATQQLVGGLLTTTNYDLVGNAISVVKDDGPGGLWLTTSKVYDKYGRSTNVIDPRGIDTKTAYDPLDRVSSVTQNSCPSGNTNPNCTGSGFLPDQNMRNDYTYDLAGNQIDVNTPRSLDQYTAYDALNRPVLATANCQTLPTSPSTSCGTQISDQNVSTSQTYDQVGNVLTTTDPLSRVNVNAYDALGRRVSQTVNCVGTGGQCNGGVTSGQNLVTTWQVDAQGNVLQVRSPRQCTASASCYPGPSGPALTDGANLATGYTYDGLLRMVSVIEDQGHPSLSATTYYAYDPSGNKISQTDGRGFMTSYTIDNLGRPTKVTDASGYAVQTYYSLAGEVIGTFNARQQRNTNTACSQANETVCNTLDRVGRIAAVSYLKSDGSTQLARNFAYDADGNKTAYSDTDVVQTTVTYDHMNRVSTVTAPAPLGTTTYTYFFDGATRTITDATGTTAFTEDRLGRTTRMVDPLNPTTYSATSYTYDVAGRLTSRTESAPSTQTWALVQSAANSHVTDSTTTQTTVTLTTPTTSGNTLVIVFSGNDYAVATPYVTAVTDNGVAHATYAFAASRGSGNYDDVEMWYASNVPAGITSITVSVAFNGTKDNWFYRSLWVGEYSGLATTGALDMWATRTIYYATQAEAGTTPPTAVQNELVVAVYEDFGNGATVTPPAGWNVRFNNGLSYQDTQVTLDQNGGPTGPYSTTFTTDVAINSATLLVTFKPASSGAVAGGVVTTANYTGADQLASKTEVSGATTLASWTNVTYDLAQNRTAETLSYYAGNPYPDPQAGTSSYQYDSFGRISQASIPSRTAANYGFDLAHNLTSNAGTTQAYNNNESLQTVGATTVGSDADGNQLQDVLGNALKWNSLSQLEAFGTSETYTYDALGRLTTVRNGAGAITTQFVYRGGTPQVVQELNGANAVVRSYAWDTTGRQLYVKTGANVYYEITNPHGDVVALASTNALAGTVHFDAWGNVLGSSGTTIPYGYQGSVGSWTNPTTGFINMGARWYYPKVGRFLSSDPAAGSANPRTPMPGLRWLYGLDNPLRYRDPNGLKAVVSDGGGDDYCDAACQAANDAATAAADARESRQQANAERNARAQAVAAVAAAQVDAAAAAAANASRPTSQTCDWLCRARNGWNAATQVVNIRPDPTRLVNGWNALGGVGTIRPDWSQLTSDNIRDSLVGLLDAGVGAAVDIGCMGGGGAICNLVNLQERGQQVVSSLILSAGGTVNTKSDAYQIGRISFTVGSIVAGGFGVVRALPSLLRLAGPGVADGAAVAARLQATTDRAATIIDAQGPAAFSPAQLAAGRAYPSLMRAYRGTAIDQLAKTLLRNDSRLSKWIADNGVEMVNRGLPGPDFVRVATNEWWDITTTARSFARHVSSYDNFGWHISI
jgi:RHS repeat-associated protein